MIKLLVILVVLLIFIISIFTSFLRPKGMASNKNQKGYKDEIVKVTVENYGKYEPNVINKEYLHLTKEEIQNIDNLIDNIINLINEKKYEEIYQNIPSLYKEMRFDTLQKFEEYMKKMFAKEEYTCVSYRLEQASCFIKICDVSNSNDEGIELKIENYKISNFKNVEIYFEDVRDIQGVFSYCYIGDIAIKIKYIALYEEKLLITMECINQSRQSTEITFDGTNVYSITRGSRDSYQLKDYQALNLDKNEKKEIELNFDYTKKITSFPTYIDFWLTINGEKVEKDIPIAYEKTEDIY